MGLRLEPSLAPRYWPSDRRPVRNYFRASLQLTFLPLPRGFPTGHFNALTRPRPPGKVTDLRQETLSRLSPEAFYGRASYLSVPVPARPNTWRAHTLMGKWWQQAERGARAGGGDTGVTARGGHFYELAADSVTHKLQPGSSEVGKKKTKRCSDIAGP